MEKPKLELHYADKSIKTLEFDKDRPNAWEGVEQKGIIEIRVVSEIGVTVKLDNSALLSILDDAENMERMPRGLSQIVPVRHALNCEKALGWFGYMVDSVALGKGERRTVACEVGYIRNKKGDCQLMRVFLANGSAYAYEGNVKDMKLALEKFNIGGLDE